MNNNKMNLLPNSKHFDNNGKPENKNPKLNVENFPMRIPDEEEEEDNKTDESNAPEQVNQSADANRDKEESAEKLTKENIEPQENSQVKIPLFIKLKNIFSRK